ncbi:MAG: GFA family protein [Rhizobiales bacterium]|nr:GFA family protein [Hyphomicrobiales bacterium]
MPKNITGSCLCGAVHYESNESSMVTAHCHCVHCRKSSGTGHCTHAGISKNNFTVSGRIEFYDHPTDSGNIVSRGFCPTCGCAIYSTNSNHPDMVFLRASSLDDPEIARPQIVVYASRAPSWDLVDPALPSFAEMPEQDQNPLKGA